MTQEQEKIVFLHLLKDKFILDNYRQYFTPLTFQMPPLRLMMKSLLAYYDKYNNIPEARELFWHVQLSNKDKMSEVIQYAGVMEEILATKYTVTQFTEDVIKEIAQEAAYMEFSRKVYERVAAKEYDGILEDLLKVSDVAATKNEDEYRCNSVETPLEERIKKYIVPNETGERLPPVIPSMNADFSGGFRVGQVIIYLAPTSFGKTTMIAHQAYIARQHNFFVLHFSMFEDMIDATVTLYDNIASKRSIGKNPSIFLSDELSHTPLAPWTIVAHQNKMSDILLHYKREKKKWNPAKMLVIVDNADYIETTGKYEAERFRTTDIYKALNRFAKEENIWLITTAQGTKKSAYQKIIRVEEVAEDYNKVRIARYVITICATDEEEKANQRRLFVAKNSHGKRYGEHRIYMDWDRYSLCDGEPDILQKEGYNK